MRDLEHVGRAVQKQPPRGVLWKKMFLKISQNSQQNTCARVPFLINFPASGLQLYQKKKKKKDWHSCFLTNFVKFLRLFFADHLWTTASSGCFCCFFYGSNQFRCDVFQQYITEILIINQIKLNTSDRHFFFIRNKITTFAI